MEKTATLDKPYAPATVATAEVVTHTCAEALPSARSHEIASPRRRSTIASRSCCCHYIRLTAKRTSAKLPNAHLTLARCRIVIVWGADLASGCMFPRKPLLDRLRASFDVSSSAAGIGGLDTSETTAAGQHAPPEHA
jgi:hypothetical protein